MANKTNSSLWALLPNDLLHEITKRLEKPSDYVRFGAVCKGWLSFAHRNFRQKHLLHIYQLNLPLLLIPNESHLERRDLYSVTEDMVYDQLLQVPHKRCCGSSYGWLLFVDEESESSLELILLNPFLGKSATIKFPPIKFCPEGEVHTMDHYGVQKAILSKDPFVSPDDYEVIALYGILPKLAHYKSRDKFLAHYKSGDKFWSYPKNTENLVLADVILYKDLILAVDRDDWVVNFTLELIEGTIRSTNCSPRYLKWKIICEQRLPAIRCFNGRNACLVENSKGDLLLARRYYAQPNLTKNFKVHRLYFPSTREPLEMEKVAMKTLDEETLFLGDNNSISVPASKYRELRPNSIYYTDDYTYTYNQSGFCMGIFNVQNGSIGKHFFPSFSIKGMPPPIFVAPQ